MLTGTVPDRGGLSPRFSAGFRHRHQTWRRRHCTAASGGESRGCTWARTRRRRAGAGART